MAKNEGLIKAGDVVEVLEIKEKEHYEDTWIESLHLTCVEREEIARDFTTFWLEPAKRTIHYQAISRGSIYRLKW